MNDTFRTIKDLVIETCMNEGAFPSYEKLTALVLKFFPTSKWQKTHYAWYKSKIKRGDIPVPGFSSEAIPLNVDGESENDVQETVEASLTLERDLHSYLALHVGEIQEGLKLAEDGVEYLTDAGRIDILAIDKQGNPTVIELKAGKAKDNALGQLLGYMGCIGTNHIKSETPIQGILIASDFEQRVIYAAKGLPNIKLIKYIVSFKLEEIT
jgi:hypothetical protein